MQYIQATSSACSAEEALQLDPAVNTLAVALAALL
jgi:hypothetical protein